MQTLPNTHLGVLVSWFSFIDCRAWWFQNPLSVRQEEMPSGNNNIEDDISYISSIGDDAELYKVVNRRKSIPWRNMQKVTPKKNIILQFILNLAALLHFQNAWSRCYRLRRWKACFIDVINSLSICLANELWMFLPRIILLSLPRIIFFMHCQNFVLILSWDYSKYW